MKKSIETRLEKVLESLRSGSAPKKSIQVRQDLKDDIDELARKIAIHFSSLSKKYKVDTQTQMILLEYIAKKVKQHL